MAPLRARKVGLVRERVLLSGEDPLARKVTRTASLRSAFTRSRFTRWAVASQFVCLMLRHRQRLAIG